MPPKRKALAEATNQGTATKPRNAKAAKTSAKSDASKKPAAKATSKSNTKDADKEVDEKTAPVGKRVRTSKTHNVKYSNADTLSKKPQWTNLQWPNIGDFLDDEDQDMPEDGQLIDEFCTRVSDLGIPVTEDGMKLCEKLDTEYRKRDQDEHAMHIYNDWNGWGMSELLENYLKDFNKDVFKKTMSPYQKWAYIEGLAVFFNGADMETVYWIGNEDGERTKEIASIFGTMILTVFDVLKEHDLFTLDSEVNNIGIISLLLLKFVKCEAVDLDCDWAPEIVRLAMRRGLSLMMLSGSKLRWRRRISRNGEMRIRRNKRKASMLVRTTVGMGINTLPRRRTGNRRMTWRMIARCGIDGIGSLSTVLSRRVGVIPVEVIMILAR